MEKITFDLKKKNGRFKVMNAVNNGPCHRRHSTSQLRSNLVAFREARIPYARTHDSSFENYYGSEHTVDISAIFPDFDADPYDPSSYDFAVTDEYIMVTLEANTEPFYRLGQRIEHYIKKFNTLPPKDFHKWAVVCEHIIRHYNEGWADGYQLGIQYWEIWNEPDMNRDESLDKKTWGGTKKQFFEFYEIAAKHLKSCFPELKIGGPALANRLNWADDFLALMNEKNVPLDFFSWHIYCTTPEQMLELAEKVKALLVKHGYGDIESILNEWNYVKGWGEEYIDSIKTVIGMKGAAFTMACMSAAQHSSIDMLMYYDARPCVLNGLFDFYTWEPLKGYYPFKWYGKFYDMSAEVVSENEVSDIYTLCGVDDEEKVLAVITYYTDEEGKEDKTVTVDFGRNGEYEIFLLDESHDAELIQVTSDLTFTLTPNSCLMIQERKAE